MLSKVKREMSALSALIKKNFKAASPVVKVISADMLVITAHSKSILTHLTVLKPIGLDSPSFSNSPGRLSSYTISQLEDGECLCVVLFFRMTEETGIDK